ncbi:MAG: thiol oxidoreductase, partial [Pannonibacter indicus]
MIFLRWRRFAAPVRLAAGICLVAGASAAAAQTRALDHRSDLSQGEREKAAQVLAAPENFAAPEPFEDMPGGAATSRKRINRDAFSHPSANLSFEEQQTFRVGNGIFRKFWVSAPSSTQASDGLGPL